jgi:hypothetical protein
MNSSSIVSKEDMIASEFSKGEQVNLFLYMIKYLPRGISS